MTALKKVTISDVTSYLSSTFVTTPRSLRKAPDDP